MKNELTAGAGLGGGSHGLGRLLALLALLRVYRAHGLI